MATYTNNDYLKRSFSSFSGCDIKATFADVEIGTLQAISYAIQREKAPIYVMGDPNPRAFSRGKRGIAGSMVFVMFDSHALLDAFEGSRAGLSKFVKDNTEISPEFISGESGPIEVDGELNYDDWSVQKAFYADQIPPFDVSIMAVNETGAISQMRIWGAELLNEGYGISVDDMVSEQQTTYVCRAITRWTRASSEENPFRSEYAAGGVQITDTRRS